MIFKQQRIGKNGKLFTIYKIRTMDNKGQVINKFLRKTKLDELPQLWNVLKGDMAIVGPRPEEPKDVAVWPEEIKKIILSVKPGLTSPASLFFFDEEDILKLSKDPKLDYWTKIKPIKFILDVFYIQHKCFLLNLAIIWLTFLKLLKRLVK